MFGHLSGAIRAQAITHFKSGLDSPSLGLQQPSMTPPRSTKHDPAWLDPASLCQYNCCCSDFISELCGIDSALECLANYELRRRLYNFSGCISPIVKLLAQIVWLSIDFFRWLEIDLCKVSTMVTHGDSVRFCRKPMGVSWVFDGNTTWNSWFLMETHGNTTWNSWLFFCVFFAFNAIERCRLRFTLGWTENGMEDNGRLAHLIWFASLGKPWLAIDTSAPKQPRIVKFRIPSEWKWHEMGLSEIRVYSQWNSHLKTG